MTEEEIKEILDYLKDEEEYYKEPENVEVVSDEIILEKEDINKLLNYITNLQEENEKLKYNARGQANDYFKDKYADEVLKIAELQRENETLKTKLEIGKTCGFCPYYDYKQRNEKAIEYTNKMFLPLKHFHQKYELLNILNGSDEK